MYPVLLELGPIKLHTYGLMIALGFLLALYLIQRDAAKIGVSANDVSEMGMWTLLIGLAGTRLFHIFMFPEFYSWSDPIGWVAIWNGGLVFQGALPFGFAYLYFAMRAKKIPVGPMCDAAFPYLPLAQAFGRMGCLFFGCCYGLRADHLPWGIRFPEGSPAYLSHANHYASLVSGADHWSYPVHPTQLYSALLLLLIAATLVLLVRYWKPFPGFTAPLYLMLYGVKRIIVEFYRGDGNPTGLAFGWLSNQQVFSAIMFLVGVFLFIYLSRRRGPTAPSSS